MIDPDQDLLSELWAHDQARLRETSLRRMIEEGRRRRRSRHALRGVLCAAALLAGGFWLGRPTPRVPVPEANLAATPPLPPDHLTVRHLTRAEAEERLQGFAVAYIGGSSEVIVLGEIPR